MSAHYSVEFERDGGGWWPGRCQCGWDGGMYPDAEDAADALMDHAFAAGLAAVSVPVPPPSKEGT